MNKALKAAKRVLPVFKQTIDGWASGVLEGSIDSNVKVSCKRGCHHCCYNMVNATMAEGALVAAHLAEKGTFEQYRAQLEKTAELSDACGEGDEATFKYMQAKVPCAFLKDGECSIYEVRPAACRMYFVVTPPEDCSPDKAGHEVGQVDARVVAGIFLTEVEKAAKPAIPSFMGPFPSTVLAGKELIERGPGAFKRWASKSKLFNENRPDSPV